VNMLSTILCLNGYTNPNNRQNNGKPLVTPKLKR
jgi:hypothetical protein